MRTTLFTKLNYSNLTSLALFYTLFASNISNAAVVIEHSGTVKVGTQYHDNLQFQTDDQKQSTYLYSVVPEYKLSALDDKNKWFGSIGINLQRASNQTIFGNREDPFAKIGWERTLENGAFQLNADYTRQSSRNTQFTTTGVVTQDGTSVTKNYGASWDYYLSQKLTLNTNARYQDNTFSGVVGLGNFTVSDFGAAVKYAYNEKFTPYVSVLATNFKAQATPENITFRYQTYTVGAEVIVNPQFTYETGIGVVQFNSDSEEVVGKLTATYLENRYDVTGTIERTVFATGLGFIDIANSISSEYTYYLTPRSSSGIRLGIRENKSGIDTQELAWSYDYELTSTWLMHVQANYSNLKLNGRESADNTSLGVFFTYTSPNF